jgi:hypothetical protein
MPIPHICEIPWLMQSWPGSFINPTYSKLLAIFAKTLGFF